MMKVLVAEDEQDSRDLLVGALAEAGYAVIEAEDGGMALEKACEERPDLILLDVMMPVMDGFEVLSRLRSLEREDPVVASIPVILLSALSAAEGEQTAIRLGAQHYITKPWEPNLLELAVKVTLREAETGNDPDASDPDFNASEGRDGHQRYNDPDGPDPEQCQNSRFAYSDRGEPHPRAKVSYVSISPMSLSWTVTPSLILPPSIAPMPLLHRCRPWA